MTQEQIKWAAQHDWFISDAIDYANNKYGVKVRDIAYAPDAKDDIMVIRYFSDFRALRNWAGY